MDRAMADMINLAVRLYKSIKQAEQQRKNTKKKVQREAVAVSKYLQNTFLFFILLTVNLFFESTLDTVELAAEMGDKFVFEEASKECVEVCNSLSAEAARYMS